MIRLSILIFSFFVALLGLINNSDAWWVILPISFVFLNIIFPGLYNLSKNRPVYFVFFTIAFLRYVVTSFWFILSGDEFKFYLLKDATETSLWMACILMIGELFFSLFILNFFAVKNVSFNKEHLRFPRNLFLYLILSLIFIIVLVNPDLLYRYNFILIPEEIFKPEDFNGLGLLSILVDFILILPPLLMLNYFIPKYNNTRNNKYVLLTLIFLLPFLLFFKGTSRFSALLPAISWMILFIMILPEFRKKIIFSIMSTSLIVMVSVSLYKQFGFKLNSSTEYSDFTFSKVAIDFNAYFSGLYNVAYCLDIDKFYKLPSGYLIFFNDLFKNLAYFSSYANLESTSSNYFNNYIYSQSGQSDQIIPVVGQSYLYFGVSGSLIMTSLCIYCLVKVEEKIYRLKNVNYIFPMALLAIYFSITMMISLNSIYAPIFNFLLPFMLILYLNDFFGKLRFK